MGASLSLSISVTNTSDTAATVEVTLKVRSTSGSWNGGSQYGYISIDGTKYEFHHSFSANKTTTLATKSKSIARTTASKSISVKGYYKTGVSPGNISKSSSTTVSARPVYSVTFDANGGTGTKTVSVYSGYTTTFPTTTRTGYTFGSWSGYAQGASTPAITSSRTYTASWTENTAILSYNANGYGTAPANDTMQYTTQTTAKDMDNVPGSGYHFTNWNTNASGTGTNYAAGATVKAANVVPSNITLYAQWALNTYTINLDLGEAAGEGSVDPIQLTKTHGVALPLPTPTWNRPFVGWSYNDSNIGSVCNVDGDVDLPEINLVALWSEEVRPVIYHYWDSATDINSTYQTYKIIDNILTLSIPKVTNYVFKGWYTDSSFSGESITTISNTYDYPTGDSRYQDPEPIHLYAKWNEAYTIVYNINNPSYDDGITAAGTVISSICENGESFTLGSSSTYTYGSGQCTASGWSLNSGTDNTISSINGQSLTDGNTITLSGYSAGYILNLYAVWTPTNYTITFNIGTSDKGFSGNDVAVSQPYYTTYQLPQKVENDWEWTIGANYHLSNWLLEDVNIPLATKILITKNLTYQAGWLYAYRVPVITNITSERFLDADYETPNTGGKFLQIAAVGVNGGYDGATVLTRSYDVRARFYEQQPDTKAYILTEDEIAQTGKTYYEIIKDSITGQSTGMFEEVRNIPEGTNPKTQEWYELSGIQEIAFYPIPLNDLPSSDEFSQQWGSSERPIFDKKLQMLYCILDIIDTTKYCIEVQNKPEGINPQQQEWYEVIENKYVKTEDTKVDNEKTYYQEELDQKSPARHFTYEFVVNLKRAIAIHVADDLSAVSMLQELEEGDSGLVIKGPMNLQRSWIWDVDPLNQILVLKWGGSNE